VFRVLGYITLHQTQIFNYDRCEHILSAISGPNFSYIFGLCLHWVSVVRGLMYAPTIWSNTPLKVGRIMSPYVTSQWALSPFNRWSVRPMMVQLRLLIIRLALIPILMPDLKVCCIMLQMSHDNGVLVCSTVGPSLHPMVQLLIHTRLHPLSCPQY
jgi:hypothetical protein